MATPKKIREYEFRNKIGLPRPGGRGIQSTQIQVWMLRILVRLGGIKQVCGPRGFHAQDSIIKGLGLEKWELAEKVDGRKFRSALESRLRKLEKEPEAMEPSTTVRKNAKHLGRAVGLSATEAALLEFAVLIHSNKALDDACDLLQELNFSRMAQSMAVMLDLCEEDVAKALGPSGTLARSGLLTVDHSTRSLRGKLDLISSKFAGTLATVEADVLTLLRGIVNRANAGSLTLDDFGHASESTEILLPYLKRARETGRAGVNVLIYGPPGTGKTELVKAISSHMNFDLYEVAYEDDDRDPVAADARLRAFRAAQCFFATQQALLMFDEIEDVFNDGEGPFGGKSTGQKRKAWINRMLETNPIPTLWISNSIHSMDRAFLRRFDMVMELAIPPLGKRRAIAEQACAGLLPPARIERIARSEVLSPAVVARATSVIRLIKDDLGEQKIAAAAERLINCTLEAQSHRPLDQQDANRLPEIYDPEFIAADTDLAQVAAGLAATGSGRLCLYGPPGTGKTAYARYLAEQMEVPLIVKRASDLLGMFVGQNEKNVARAFAEATREGAILLIDEVDSFLRDRREAQWGWEASLVNEMLTQMESFNGIFIASTNLMDNLDQASLRRFDLKVKFNYLRLEQVLKLYLRYCEMLGIVVSETQDCNRLRGLTQLTPGDFAAVFRRHRFHPITSAARLVDALAAECEVKEAPVRRIGFVH